MYLTDNVYDVLTCTSTNVDYFTKDREYKVLHTMYNEYGNIEAFVVVDNNSTRRKVRLIDSQGMFIGGAQWHGKPKKNTDISNLHVEGLDLHGDVVVKLMLEAKQLSKERAEKKYRLAIQHIVNMIDSLQ